ncbi:MAG: glycosyltransferase family 4 protein [Acidobacteriota bacterium]
MRMRVLLLNNVPTPYFTPLFEKIGEESGWDLTVCYSSDWNRDVGWQEKLARQTEAHGLVILDQRIPWLRSLAGSSLAAAVALFNIMLRERPDYLICYGYTLKPQVAALLWAIFAGTPFAVIGDANYFADSAVGMKRVLKNIWLRRVTNSAAALVSVGTANRLFWEAYGARPAQLFEAGFAVDNEFYAQAVDAREEDAAKLRDGFGLNGKVVFLFVGRLAKRKNVDLIIRAAHLIADNEIAIVIAGSGEELESLKALAVGYPGVIFAGSVAPQELPLYYAMADALILPAEREPWGLVINEAMASGLAVIAHKHCGAAVDLVDEKNGVKLEGFSVEEVARAMRLLVGDELLLRAMQRNSREKIQHWSIEAATRGIICAVEASCLKR